MQNAHILNDVVDQSLLMTLKSVLDFAVASHFIFCRMHSYQLMKLNSLTVDK